MNAITIDIPFPPSVNRLWRRAGTGVVLSDQYRCWIKRCDGFLLYTKQRKGMKTITGNFTALIILDQTERGRSDADNAIKATLDYAQRIELISNDKNADRVTVEWGEAPHGCRLVLCEVAQ